MKKPSVQTDVTHSVREYFSEKRPYVDVPTGTTSWYWALLTVLNVLDGLGRTGGPEWRESSPTWKCTSKHNHCNSCASLSTLKIKFSSFISTVTSITSVHENFPKLKLERILWLKQQDKEVSSHSAWQMSPKLVKICFLQSFRRTVLNFLCSPSGSEPLHMNFFFLYVKLFLVASVMSKQPPQFSVWWGFRYSYSVFSILSI